MPVVRPQQIEMIPVSKITVLNPRSRNKRQHCGSAWKKDPGSGVIGVEKGPLIPVV